MLSVQDKKLFQLIDRLMKAPSDPGEIHICPVCGGRLHVHFDLYSRGDKKITGIQCWCEECELAMAIDTADLPVWLSQNDTSPSPTSVGDAETRRKLAQ